MRGKYVRVTRRSLPIRLFAAFEVAFEKYSHGSTPHRTNSV